MPNIGPFHPQLVHFVVALGLAGVALRLVSLTGRAAWTRPAGSTLLLITALASVVAAQSGTDAHESAEHIPGVRDAVQDHEELGEDARDLFLLVGLLEVAALAMRKQDRLARGLYLASGVAGVVAAAVLYDAAEHGGTLVYSYAGGIGTRTGDTADVHRLLIAGLYHEARVSREARRSDDAARLTDELARQLPNDPNVSLLVIESTLEDRHDPAGALAALAALPVPNENPRFEITKGMLTAKALVAAGHPDSAHALLTALSGKYPNSGALSRALAEPQ
jgi:uncharacterized membrane protein